MRSPFEQLGLSPEAGEREVRRAYARLLKGMDTVAQPEAFMGLRAAFEQALTQARRRAERAERAEPPDTESAQRPSGEWPSQGAQREATTPGLSHPAKAQDFDAPSAAFASAPASESESESAAGPESASPPASEWDREPPLVVARRLLESMPWRFAPEDLAAATQSLKTVLAQPALQGLQVREAFEALLAQRLETLVFGRRRSVMLLAADQVFDWRRRGMGLPVLESVLDAFAALGRLQKEVAMALLGDPNPATSRALVLTPRNLQQFEQQFSAFLSWWLPTDHLARWRAVWSAMPWYVRARQGFSQGLQPLRRLSSSVLVVLVLAGMGVMAFNLLAARGRTQEATRVDRECGQALESQRRSAWTNVPVQMLSMLERCRLNPSMTAADRHGYDQAMRIQAGLKSSVDGERYVPLSSAHLVLNLPDGRAFGFLRGADGSDEAYCADVQAFIQKASWLRLGDLPAARALVQEVAWCASRFAATAARPQPGTGSDAYMRYLLGGRTDRGDLVWTLLRHIDAWPDGPSPRLPLADLVRQNTPEGYRWQLPAPVVPGPLPGPAR